MEPSHALKALLQFQLATDASSVLHLPYVLSSLSQESLLPSSHLPKWTTRINSLLHSKDAGARWAGLCIAHKTSTLSRNTMIECAQSWLGVALPLLSKNEPLPTIKASIRLMSVIFSAGVGYPEYQRQVATPNVPKFTSAIIAIAEKSVDEELRILILTALTSLVPIYPTLCRASHTALSTLALRFLNGSAPSPIPDPLLTSASQLYAVLHFTGGKVGAANLWRKSVDETLAFGWSSFFALRTTFPSEGPNTSNPPNVDEALIGVPLHLDKLRCCTVVLCDLLSSITHRPVQVPLGPIVKFITALLGCTKEDKGKENADPTIQAMETSILPDLWKSGCIIAQCLAKCVRQHLSPNLTRLISYLTYHLEQNSTASQRLIFLTTVRTLLQRCQLLDSPLVPTRLAKAVLPLLSVVLATPSPSESQSPDDVANSQQSKKGKKRARGYEGDEVFKLTREVICPGPEDGKVLLAALNVMRLLLQNPNLSPAMKSISARVLLSILLGLPQMSPTSLSPDLGLHDELLHLVQSIATELGSGTTSVMSKSLGMIVRATVVGDENEGSLRDLEILLHPRVPPLVRSLPHVESLSLFSAEEPQEEADARRNLGLHVVLPNQPRAASHVDEDVLMKDSLTTPRMASVTSIHSVDSPPLKPLPSATANIQPSPAPPTLPSPVVIETSHIQPTAAAGQKKNAPRPAVPQPVQPVIVPNPLDEEDNEEMPEINMDSDSDEE